MWDIVDKLAQWPSLQYGVVVIIVVFSVMTYAKVLAAKFPQSVVTPQQTTTSEVSFLYFQGWFKSVLDGISELRTNQELNKLQVQEKFGEELRKTRHDLKNSLANVQAEILGELDKLDKKIDDIQHKRNR